jgi:hypothetical protein
MRSSIFWRDCRAWRPIRTAPNARGRGAAHGSNGDGSVPSTLPH